VQLATVNENTQIHSQIKTETMASKSDPISRLRAKSLVSGLLVGLGAGALSGAGDGVQAMGVNAFGGLIMIFVGGYAGGLLGMLARNVKSLVRPSGRTVSELGAEAVLPASSFGALMGLLVTLVAFEAGSAHFGAGIGAACGGFVGGLAAEEMGGILYLLEGGSVRENRTGRISLDESGKDPEKK
jgi:hypothetical protein